MKRLLALLSVLVVAFCTGCGDSHEKLASESVTTMKKMVTVLEGVKDESSAKSAKPELQSLMEKLNDINTRQTKLPAPSEAELKAMDEKYGKEMDEVSQKFQSQMLRVAFDPKIGPELQGIDMKKPGR